jgi:hypothetical protein
MGNNGQNSNKILGCWSWWPRLNLFPKTWEFTTLDGAGLTTEINVNSETRGSMAFFQSEKPGFSSHNETGTSRFRLKGFQIVSTAALQQPLPPPLGRFIATTCAASFHRTIINPPVRPPRLAGGLVRVFQINCKNPRPSHQAGRGRSRDRSPREL